MNKTMLTLALLCSCDDRTVRIENPNGLGIYVKTSEHGPGQGCEVSVKVGERPKEQYITLLVPWLIPYEVKSKFAEKPL